MPEKQVPHRRRPAWRRQRHPARRRRRGWRNSRHCCAGIAVTIPLREGSRQGLGRAPSDAACRARPARPPLRPPFGYRIRNNERHFLQRHHRPRDQYLCRHADALAGLRLRRGAGGGSHAGADPALLPRHAHGARRVPRCRRRTRVRSGAAAVGVRHSLRGGGARGVRRARRSSAGAPRQAAGRLRRGAARPARRHGERAPGGRGGRPHCPHAGAGRRRGAGSGDHRPARQRHRAHGRACGRHHRLRAVPPRGCLRTRRAGGEAGARGGCGRGAAAAGLRAASADFHAPAAVHPGSSRPCPPAPGTGHGAAPGGPGRHHRARLSVRRHPRRRHFGAGDRRRLGGAGGGACRRARSRRVAPPPRLSTSP